MEDNSRSSANLVIRASTDCEGTSGLRFPQVDFVIVVLGDDLLISSSSSVQEISKDSKKSVCVYGDSSSLEWAVHYLHSVGNQISRVESDTELANHGNISSSSKGFHESLGS